MAYIEVWFPEQGVTDENCEVNGFMIMKYLLISCLLQTDSQQLVSMDICKKRLDGGKERS